MQWDVFIALNILAIQCINYAIKSYTIPAINRPLKIWSMAFFVFTGISAAIDAVHDGILANTDDKLFKITLYYLNLTFLGIAVSVSWNLGAAIIGSRPLIYIMSAFSIVSLISYYMVLLFFSNNFLIAVIYYSLAAINILFTFIVRFFISHSKIIIKGVVGLFLILIASCLHQAGVTIKVLGFTKNTVLHLLISISFYMIFQTIKYFMLEKKQQTTLKVQSELDAKIIINKQAVAYYI